MKSEEYIRAFGAQKTKHLTIRVTEETHKRLDKVSCHLGIPQAIIIRHLIAEYLDEEFPKTFSRTT